MLPFLYATILIQYVMARWLFVAKCLLAETACTFESNFGTLEAGVGLA